MFCYQCEQTFRSDEGVGCAGPKGMCGKDAATSDLQDILLHVCEGIGQYLHRARALGATDAEADRFILYAFFTTLTNVNFNAGKFVQLIQQAAQFRDRAKALYETAAPAAGTTPETLSGAAAFAPAKDMSGLLAQASEAAIQKGAAIIGEDVVGLRSLVLYGLKGVCAYSLANTPNWDGTLEFLIRLHPQGAFSAYLKDHAKPDDQILVKGPQGGFTADETSQAPRWFVAGGTGVAPMLSMLRQMAELGDAREARLFFAVNTQEELFALDAIEELKRTLPNLGATICVWKPDSDWPDFAGTPVAALDAVLAEGATRPDIYVCGPPALIEATEAASLNAGVHHDRIFSEPFSPA